MKKSKNIVLIVTPVLSAALLNGCGSSQPRTVVNPTIAATPVATPAAVAPEAAQTRDVYNNLNDCVKDWGSKELCEQMGDDDDRNYRTRYTSGGAGRYFYGPRYAPNNRIITYKGKTVTPTGKVSKLPSFTGSVPNSKTTSSSSTTTSSKPTSSTSSTTSTLPSTTSKSTTSSTSPSTTTSSTSSTYTPYSSSSTTRSGFGGGSSSYSSSSSSGS